MLPRSVVGALLDLEKLARAVSKEDDGAFSRDTLEKLNGSWRLVFTTGTVDTQKRVGKINYFPIKAVQSFNTQTSPMTLTNGIFAGDFALLQFYGDFEWLEDKRRLEFDFDEIAVLGFRIQLPPQGFALDELEREVIRHALERHEGNVSQTARYLHISRQTLIYRMKKHELR